MIKVNASSVNPVDWKVVESGSGLPIKFPHILGFDLAGTVVQCPGCKRLKVRRARLFLFFPVGVALAR
jgi:NADPH:quinone reductase-like Zn-dependent oxidoreductase